MYVVHMATFEYDTENTTTHRYRLPLPTGGKQHDDVVMAMKQQWDSIHPGVDLPGEAITMSVEDGALVISMAYPTPTEATGTALGVAWNKGFAACSGGKSNLSNPWL